MYTPGHLSLESSSSSSSALRLALQMYVDRPKRQFNLQFLFFFLLLLLLLPLVSTAEKRAVSFKLTCPLCLLSGGFSQFSCSLISHSRASILFPACFPSDPLNVPWTGDLNSEIMVRLNYKFSNKCLQRIVNRGRGKRREPV